MTTELNGVATPKTETFEFDENILSPSSLSLQSPTSSASSPASPPSPSSMDTPRSSPDAPSSSESSSDQAGAASGEGASATPEKKPVKKRRSWGQELPTPTTNLPPRKRAKTEAEKEQRRIERVLRNRAAAQSSRERKRKEVEALEENRNHLARDNVKLKQQNEQLQALCKQLNQRMEAIIEQNHWMMEQTRKWTCNTCKHQPENDILPSPPLSIKSDPSSPLPLPSDPSTPALGTLDPSQLSTPSDSDEDPFSSTQLTAAKLCDRQCQLKTGPSSEKELGWMGVNLTTIRWAELMMTLFMTLFLMISSPLVPNKQNPWPLTFFLLICSWISNELVARVLRREPLTISLSCALLSLDATSLAPWFECTSGKRGHVLFVSGNGSEGSQEASLSTRKGSNGGTCSWEERASGKLGRIVGRDSRWWLWPRLKALDFSNLLFQGIG